MAVLEDVVLVADGGDVTAGRQKHTFVYGEFNVQLPEGVEQVETDGRLADGYVYRPEGEIAPFDVGFARADVTVDLEVQSTDLELVVDEAQRDAEGDVFFERDITPAGLGEFVPGVDFVVGDVVSVERWRVLLPLPVTGWEMVSSASDGVVADRVHVSGQLISDSAARVRRNADLRREVEADKRQLQRSVRSVRSYADSAVAVERSERVADVAQVREVLGGAQADEGDLLAQLAAVQSQITGMVDDGETPPPPGLLNSYLWMNTQLWKAQREIDEAQDQLTEQQNARQNEQGAIMDAMQAQLGRMGDRAWQVGTDGDGVWRVDGSTVQALGSWVGTAVLDVTRWTRSGNTDVTVVTYPREVRRVDVGTTRSWKMKSAVEAAVFYYRRADGSVARLDQRLPQFVADTWWTPVRTVTVEKDRLVSVELCVDWAAANRGSLYGVRITVDGRTVAEESSTSVGPLAPWGNGARSQSVSRNIDIKAGQTVRFEARCNHAGEAQRTASGGNTRLWWMEV